jgi:predicted nucleic acid-binding protein
MHPHQSKRTMARLNSLTTINVDEAIADQAGHLIYQYARKNIRLSLPDTLIAATALQHSLILATTNTKHFPMPTLRLHPVP